MHGIRELSSSLTRRTVYSHGSQTRGSRDFISVGQGARRHHLIQCDPPNHAWQGPGCATVGDHGFPMASATCVSETVQVWSLLVEEVRADTGRRYRRLWHQRALARAPETLLVRRRPKASIPDQEAPDDTDLPHRTLPSRRIVCAIAHGCNTDRRSTVPSQVLRNFSRHDQVTYCFPTHDYHTVGEANFYVVYVDTAFSSAD